MTHRLIAIKWTLYGLWTLLFLLMQQLVLPYLCIAGVHPFLLPLLSAVAASLEGKWAGPVFGLVLGLVCDMLFPGAFPCFYAVALPLCAAVAGFAARHAIMPGLVCSLAVSAAALLLTGGLNTLASAYFFGTPLRSALWLMAREMLVSLPLAIVIHPAFFRVHRRFAGR